MSLLHKYANWEDLVFLSSFIINWLNTSQVLLNVEPETPQQLLLLFFYYLGIPPLLDHQTFGSNCTLQQPLGFKNGLITVKRSNEHWKLLIKRTRPEPLWPRFSYLRVSVTSVVEFGGDEVISCEFLGKISCNNSILLI